LDLGEPGRPRKGQGAVMFRHLPPPLLSRPSPESIDPGGMSSARIGAFGVEVGIRLGRQPVADAVRLEGQVV